MNITSENAVEMQKLSAEARKANNKKRAEARELIKSKGVKALLEEYGVSIDKMSAQQKTEISMHLLTELLSAEHLMKLKHSLRLEELDYKHELETLAKLNNQVLQVNQPSEGATGLSIEQALASGLINKDTISMNDVNVLSLYV
ncbi:hypothetical protein [Vibrio splendidus]|uniref:Uncharacterized protein n=1 Tax=Vibrio splendidus TaxID=29497 RepID=A0A2T5E551_VIBSP|nr:hypothetical protein [Vibrio splendidus]OEE60122.1 hypothetical protein A147_03825 [Vibrio splendidus FF-6]PTP14454.1 hypothetical protein CWO36_21215 [Vibrio splendidus]UOE82176.1 hypothetical protein LTQ03_15715 [Vibrio splendidus]